MFWVYALLVLTVVLGAAAWYDRRKKIRRVIAPDRPLVADMRAEYPYELDSLNRPWDNDPRS